MNYLDIYYSRINHAGETTAERIRDGGIRSFERWLAESPHTIEDLSVERGIYFSGILLTNKDQEMKKLLFLHVANDIPIQVGDIMNWRQDDGEVEKWLLLSEEKKVNGKYRTFVIIKCNYLIKWIDNKGYLQQSWAYVLSSTDDKIKGNFRTWHNLITPQPNKYAEIIMPRSIYKGAEIINTVDRGTNFIIEDESWKMVETDFTSVKGIIYMSLTENKVNFQYDYLGEGMDDVADMDKYKFPVLPTLYKVGDIIMPIFEEDTLNQWDIILIKPDDCDFIDDDFHAIAPGQCIITMALKNRPSITRTVEITVNAIEETVLYLKGADTVKLDRYAIYELVNEDGDIPVAGTVNFSIMNKANENIPLATIAPAYDTNNNELPYANVLHANAKNKLGEVILIAEYDGKTYNKTIKITPLW